MEKRYKGFNFIGFLKLFRTEKNVRKQIIITGGGDLNDKWMSKHTGFFHHRE